jgi:sugar lactone lactonase YvrE
MAIDIMKEQRLEIVRSISWRSQDPLFGPACIRIKNDRVYVVDEIGHKVHVLDTELNAVTVFGEYGKEPGRFWYPSSLCFDQDENMYVADKWNHRIQIFDKDHTFKDQIGKYGVGLGEFNEPASVAWADGVLYVAERSNGRLQGIDLMKKTVHCYQNNAPIPQFYESTSFKNNKHYKRWLTNVTRFYSMHDQFLECGFKVGGLEYPEELVIGDHGNVIAIDKVNAIAVMFSPRLEYMKYLAFDVPSFADKTDTVCRVNCATADERGVVWFGADACGGILRVDSHGISVLRLSGVRISAIAVSGSYLYISDFWNGSIFQLELKEQ